MIQRIQSVYLLIVAILSIIVISNPIGSFVGTDNSITEFTNLSLVAMDGTEDYKPWALFAIQIISAVISIITVFLYKKRMLQIRFTLFNIILKIGYYVAMVSFVFMLKGEAKFLRIFLFKKFGDSKINTTFAPQSRDNDANWCHSSVGRAKD